MQPPADESAELVDPALPVEADADLGGTQAQFVRHLHFLDAVEGVDPADHCFAGGDGADGLLTYAYL